MRAGDWMGRLGTGLDECSCLHEIGAFIFFIFTVAFLLTEPFKELNAITLSEEEVPL